VAAYQVPHSCSVAHLLDLAYNQIDIHPLIKNLHSFNLSFFNTLHFAAGASVPMPLPVPGTGPPTPPLSLFLVKFLVKEKNMDVSEKDKEGSTALHYAARSNHFDIVKWLVEMKADVNVTNEKGETASDVAKYKPISDFLTGCKTSIIE
jgi:ankyrin repeat protein